MGTELKPCQESGGDDDSREQYLMQRLALLRKRQTDGWLDIHAAQAELDDLRRRGDTDLPEAA